MVKLLPVSHPQAGYCDLCRWIRTPGDNRHVYGIVIGNIGARLCGLCLADHVREIVESIPKESSADSLQLI